MKRHPKSNFPRALRSIRKARGVAQEEFDQVSSRTYVSALERGVKAPTIGKVEQLSEVLRVHPLTLMAAAYLGDRVMPSDITRLLKIVADELAEFATN
ncbi:helix-turn-helix transcriptional regulator [Piscinibacter gummiphilus]|uniref:Helix-turn-helix transcriptional regulator n=1 Tax=Piscinibacter gummiphilus TaxID=946333 RepID=A0ABZ0D3J9_9BURK|nr:helix-turn-helix transcriptional regulator [Piscinibacter gummiphilus]WOB11361.1 helix-turn-helix transcriptional regulator [Piscinibacter gummiphilus]